MAGSGVRELLDKLAESREEFLRAVEGLGGERLYTPPEPGDWTLMEILAHSVSFKEFYSEQMEKVQANPGCDFGRQPDSPERLDPIIQHRHDSLEVALSRLESAHRSLMDRVATLRDEELGLTGKHLIRGPMTIQEMVERFFVGHELNHAQQIRETRQRLAARRAEGSA